MLSRRSNNKVKRVFHILLALIYGLSLGCYALLGRWEVDWFVFVCLLSLVTYVRFWFMVEEMF